ncbi:MAG: DUF3662 domain-containing protein [Anaerolineales bacterium]|nr:DUF3662 domain-containing protein [Chloroflexota bacterium]MBL6979623.1 DUF3662 domain-containing protein [Anaerolineales bacterium]
MNSIINKLDQLEARLQTLIEGHIARLLPAQLSRDDLMQKLIAAMQAGARQGEDGDYLAPDTFFIQLNPQHITGLPVQDSLLEELANLLQQAGDQADFEFMHPLTINLVAEPEMDLEDSDILARISKSVYDDTLAIDMETGDDAAANIPQNAFIIVNGSQVFNLEDTVINIGRKSDNELIIDDPRISRQHAQLRATRGRYVIFDLDSTGGTFVNGHRVTQSTLQPRDVISLAGVPLVYAQDELAADETQQYNLPTGHDDEHPTKGDMI